MFGDMAGAGWQIRKLVGINLILGLIVVATGAGGRYRGLDLIAESAEIRTILSLL